MATMTRIQALKTFFGGNTKDKSETFTYRDVTTKELQDLSKEDRQVLADGAAKLLGVEIEVSKT